MKFNRSSVVFFFGHIRVYVAVRLTGSWFVIFKNRKPRRDTFESFERFIKIGPIAVSIWRTHNLKPIA